MIFEDGQQQRDFVSVHDVVQANLLAMERSEADGMALNIGSGEAVTDRRRSRAPCPRAWAWRFRRRSPENIAPATFGTALPISRRRGGCWAISRNSDFSQGVRELVAWLREQTAVDRVQQAARELDTSTG